MTKILSELPYKKQLTQRIRADIIKQYRRGNPIYIIAQRTQINQERVLGVVIDSLLESADEKKG